MVKAKFPSRWAPSGQGSGSSFEGLKIEQTSQLKMVMSKQKLQEVKRNEIKLKKFR